MNKEIKIKNFYGKIVGKIIEKPNGDKIVKDFYGKILGRYDARTKTTKDFYGRIIARGDATASLIDITK